MKNDKWQFGLFGVQALACPESVSLKAELHTQMSPWTDADF